MMLKRAAQLLTILTLRYDPTFQLYM